MLLIAGLETSSVERALPLTDWPGSHRVSPCHVRKCTPRASLSRPSHAACVRPQGLLSAPCGCTHQRATRPPAQSVIPFVCQARLIKKTKHFITAVERLQRDNCRKYTLSSLMDSGAGTRARCFRMQIQLCKCTRRQ